MKKKTLLFLCLSCFYSYYAMAQQDWASYVQTMIGTDNSKTLTATLFGKGVAEKGQVIPAVFSPYGMNFWTPQTEDTELKSVSPYYYKNTRIQGFRNSHWINGGCTQDYGSVTLMPVSGKLKCQPKDRASLFSHSKEISTPYYYSVQLEDYGVNAEMTGTSRAGIFRFTYQKDGDAYLVVNPNNDEGEGYIEYDPVKNEIRGYNPVYRIYQGFGQSAGFSGYFIIALNTKVSSYGIYKDSKTFEGVKSVGKAKGIGVYVKFQTKKDSPVLVKVGSSFTGMEGAANNLNKELPGWDFNKVKKNLHREWNIHLSAIQIDDNNEDTKQQFYSAMYRASFLPHAVSDVDGSHPSFSKGQPIVRTEGYAYYDDFSMWDTYRSLHPLLNIIEPGKSTEMIRSLLDKYDQGGWFPIFPCWNSYTSEMIGDHCISLIGDAYVKGIRNFDTKKAYKAMRQNAFETPEKYEDYKDGLGRRALDSYIKYGYIPLEDSVKEAFHREEQVSRTLEYAYDDYVLSVLAKKWDYEEDAEILAKRALNYRNVIDPRTGYAQGRHKDGKFIDEFNALKFCHFITEGTPCHYTWYVPHDVQGLAKSMGGKDAFVARLDSMFSEKRYWHGNEPCHQIGYLYNYMGMPWKTQKEVRHIVDTEYLNLPGGLSGNDDAGQMSSWYIFSTLGFYPVCPGTPNYIIGTPFFRKVVISLKSGKRFIILTPEASSKNIYIQKVLWNGEEYDKTYITHDMILKGGTLEFKMGDIPNKSWGTSDSSIPPSMSDIN